MKFPFTKMQGAGNVSVEQAALRPGETTQLFVIRERRADD